MQAAQDVLPSRDIRILELMELLAVFEASSKKMLPERYRQMETAEVLQRLDAVKRLIGPRLP